MSSLRSAPSQRGTSSQPCVKGFRPSRRIVGVGLGRPRGGAPWGDEIAVTITDLANYFVTPDGRQLVDVLDTALDTSGRINQPLRIL
ncbi:Imm70 family immunity protein [Nocardioides sp. LHG3406-4]|uniref:Imm70 family immunity protein n=1 Tax=Nocardioides sp. LHG3406-4 TaxID=2804575 RepID=UPI003CE6E45B